MSRLETEKGFVIQAVKVLIDDRSPSEIREDTGLSEDLAEAMIEDLAMKEVPDADSVLALIEGLTASEIEDEFGLEEKMAQRLLNLL